MNALPETIREKLLKIKALADSGVDGERDAARRLLARLCDEHNITPEQLLSTQVKRYDFDVTKAEFGLFGNVLSMVTNSVRIKYWAPKRWPRNGIGCVGVELTPVQFEDLWHAWHHYRAILRDELAALDAEKKKYLRQLKKRRDSMAASIAHKFQIFADDAQDASGSGRALSPEELAAIIANLREIEGAQWRGEQNRLPGEQLLLR